jgi:hypothetical protein
MSLKICLVATMRNICVQHLQETQQVYFLEVKQYILYFNSMLGKKPLNLTSNLTDTAFRMMHEKFKDCKYIIIDEISMVGSFMLYKIHNRLQVLAYHSEELTFLW